MAKFGFWLLLCGAVVVLLAAPAAADQVPLAAGDRIRLYDSTGDSPGGEFKAIVQEETSPGTWEALSPEVSWQSFCVEVDEYFSGGQLLKVKDVSLTAQRGGSNTNSGDEISLETAWLYTQFWNGDLVGLNGAGTDVGDSNNDDYYDNHADNATHLQEAIWFLEDESLGVDNHYVTLAEAAVANGDFVTWGNVRVVTLERWKNGAWTYAQDQLWMRPVPEPGTFALFGLGLMGAAFYSRRRRAS